MKYIGIDYGKARIGVAKSDALGFLASPIGTIHEKNFRIQLDKVCEIIESEKPDKIIFGLPKNMDGTEGESAELIHEFSGKLSDRTGVPCELVDERLSTVSAHKILNDVNMSGSKKRRDVVDTISAVIILQSYLDKK
ncbi:MAG: Holliday junction resolvase RuvX [Clostridia bacterium]|nr:Holliday junction resolvase RuvX [Clostridia bacterium]